MESEVCEREMARPAYVEDLPLPSEGATEDSSVDKKKVAGTEVKIKKESSKVSESRSTCELQITEELEEFADVGQKKNNDIVENPTRPVPKPTKRIITESKPAPKTATVKKKLEPKNVGPARDDDAPPWNGITLNRCLVVAAFLALLSVGFQVVQDAVDMEDELGELEAELWTAHDTTDQQPPEPWFFEGWFGTSPGEEPDVVEEPEKTEELEELEEPEETELPELEDELAEDLDTSVAPEPLEPKIEEKEEKSQEKRKQSEQWGLKAKSKYMEAKAIKIRRASETGFQEKEVFPFIKRPKKAPKHPEEFKEKSYKQNDKEKRFEHKKHEDKKQHKKRKEEPNKYFKYGKERKEEKDKKGSKQHQQERNYKKQYDAKHHG